MPSLSRVRRAEDMPTLYGLAVGSAAWPAAPAGGRAAAVRIRTKISVRINKALSSKTGVVDKFAVRQTPQKSNQIRAFRRRQTQWPNARILVRILSPAPSIVADQILAAGGAPISQGRLGQRDVSQRRHAKFSHVPCLVRDVDQAAVAGWVAAAAVHIIETVVGKQRACLGVPLINQRPGEI